MVEWPEWWQWEIELSSHLFKRMVDRQFNEAEIRVMLADATDYYANHEEGRWVIDTCLDDEPWEVIVEPDVLEGILVVVTAYRVT